MQPSPPIRAEISASQRRGVVLDRLKFEDGTRELRLFIQPDTGLLSADFYIALGLLVRKIEELEA